MYKPVNMGWAYSVKYFR